MPLKPFLGKLRQGSLTLIILLFHVGKIEFLSVNSFYCMVFCRLLPVTVYCLSPVGVRLDILLVLPTAYIFTQEFHWIPLAIPLSKLFLLA